MTEDVFSINSWVLRKWKVEGTCHPDIKVEYYYVSHSCPAIPSHEWPEEWWGTHDFKYKCRGCYQRVPEGIQAVMMMIAANPSDRPTIDLTEN